ncbi:MAG: prephenate dehydrogenase [Candidatus Omnitrophica bacterium]|nr:prephenate dehydrogenase [Candidatus Omnitrophota bacterium]
MFKKIAIVGVGLIGGSIGMAARKKGLAREVVGIGRRKSSVRKAILKKAIDTGSLSVERGIQGADLIIIATPVDKVLTKIIEAACYAQKDAIIIDVNSTKEKVLKHADMIMPEGVSFVGTHPMAGSERSGILIANAGLFKDTICIITPTADTDKPALKKVKAFWRRLGAEVVIFSPAAHDMVVSNISHLPHLLSYALCNTASPKDIKMAGPGFKDTTRIAKSDPRMWSEIFIQNRDSLLRSIEAFEKNLKGLKAAVKSKNAKALLKRLNQAKVKRESLG